jgi:transcriptional regulator with XRE-family HTH domain
MRCDPVVPKTVGERVTLLRRRRGMTKQELAERAGLHRNTVSNIENERLVKPPDDETVSALAAVLGVRPEDLRPTPPTEGDADDDGGGAVPGVPVEEVG